MMNMNEQNPNLNTEEEVEEAEPQFMSLESDAEFSEEMEDKRAFYQFIHDNDLREEALELIDQVRGQAPVESETESEAETAPVAVASGKVDLKAIRKSLKKNQAEMAKALKVSQGLISLMETGKTPISAEVEAQLRALQK